MNTANDSGNSSVPVRRAKFDSLSLYEVTEAELVDLERGGPASLFLNLAIFMLSVAICFLIAIQTTDVKPEHTYVAYAIVTAVGFAVGLVLTILWLVYRQSTSVIIKRIKKRMPPDNPVDVDANEAEAVDIRSSK